MTKQLRELVKLLSCLKNHLIYIRHAELDSVSATLNSFSWDSCLRRNDTLFYAVISKLLKKAVTICFFWWNLEINSAWRYPSVMLKMSHWAEPVLSLPKGRSVDSASVTLEFRFISRNSEIVLEWRYNLISFLFCIDQKRTKKI